MNQQNNILTSVSIKAAAEISEKGISPEELIEKAQTIYNFHIAWLKRLEEKKDVKS